MGGSMSYHAGLSAEEQVSRHYGRAGHRVLAQRWRGKGGEIDLIVDDGVGTVFVEVKQSATHSAAAESLRPRQIRRLFDCASEFMAGLPHGQNSVVRFDVALVDGAGRIDVIENALAA